MKNPNQPKKPTGPKPTRFKINKPWDKAVKEALVKERPKEGWPDLNKKEKG